MRQSLLILFIVSVFVIGLFVVQTDAIAQVKLKDQINQQVNAGVRGAELPAKKDIRTIVADVIQILLSLTGMFFMILVILGGFKYVNAKGDEGEVEAGKNMIKAAIFGLIIILSAYSITLFVAGKFPKAVVEGGRVQRGQESIPEVGN
ncbi:MAG: hypothetical protein KBC17_03150 [Candidatus Pacebacteria bacterium]|nr:hypothetical protein [Candidatus Paceibacterota bacterium]